MDHWLNGTNNENPISVPFFPPQIPHGLAWFWAWISAVWGRRLTAWDTRHPFIAVMLDLQAKYNSCPRVYWCVIEGKIEGRIEMREDEEEDVCISWMIFRKRGHWKFESERIRSRYAGNSIWKRLRIFRKTDYGWVIVVNMVINLFNLVFYVKYNTKNEICLPSLMEDWGQWSLTILSNSLRVERDLRVVYCVRDCMVRSKLASTWL